jgi:hypothetical protein
LRHGFIGIALKRFRAAQIAFPQALIYAAQIVFPQVLICAAHGFLSGAAREMAGLFDVALSVARFVELEN